MFYSEKDDREKRLRFSIRKVSFGAASVAVAALYLFMGSGAVSAEEAQAVQSNEEVAADKDSETEKKSENQQPTYAAPAAKEQGSATNTEAGDEGKQESHPGTKEEEANSSERSETTTKTRSDENSVSGDSSSPKSEGEGTRLEEASSKPKVRKRREAAPAPTATATDDDPDANQVYTAPGDDASVTTLGNSLNNLQESIENNTKVQNMSSLGESSGVAAGQVKEITEFGGWKAITSGGSTDGKFAIARKTDSGVFPIETVNTVFKQGDTSKNLTWIKESVFDRTNDYILLLSEVRTKATMNNQTFDKQAYKSTGEAGGIARGLEGFNGIEKTFKVYTPKVGTKVTIEFKTGYTGDIDGQKAKYKVELIAKMANSQIEQSLYDVTFDPSSSSSSSSMTLTAAKETLTKQNFSASRSLDKEKYNEMLASSGNRPGGEPGKFKSKLIDIPEGYTEYTVRISSADNSRLGMGYQIDWEHYALPVTGAGFNVTQDTSKVAKDLSQKVYDKLMAQKEEDTKWSTPETKAAYEEKLQKIKEKIESGASTSDYQTVVKEALEKQKQLNEGQEIKDKAKKAIADKLKEKKAEIEKNSKLSPAEKEAAKKQAQAEADKATQAITNANSQAEVTVKETEGTTAIGNVNPIGTDMAVDAIAEAAARKMAEIEDNDELSEDEKTAEKAKVEAAVRKAGQAIRKAKEAKYQAGVEQAQTDALSEVTAINPVAKDKAKKAIADKLKEKEAEIEKNSKLSSAEKEAAKKQAQAEADKATQAITNAQTQDEVANSQDEGTKAIDDVNPIGTDMAVDAIAEAAAIKMAEIEDNDKLSEDEKNAAKEEVAEAVRKAGEAIRKAKKAKNQGDVDQAQADALSEVTAINPVGKDKAKADLDKAAETEKAEINADTSLTSTEKEQKVKDLEAKLAEEKAKIDSAADADKVAEAKTAGETAIAGVHTNGDLEALKKAAKADLDKAAETEKAEINADTSLTSTEKEQKVKDLEAKLAEEKAKIDSAADADKVAEAKTAGETAIAGVHTNGDLEALKNAAKADLAKKLADKLAAIDNTPNATKEEKDAAKDRAKQAANQAIQAINAASDQAGVDKAQAEGIAAIAAVNPVAKDKAKEAALPNTGSRSDSTTAALGLLSIFGAVGLLFSKKKKDDEEA
ncbi:DUF1542 domain-containing protein [Streptococcus pseudopneumoniae]|uniref:DUF1542 domain-containing protein n=1 Tax=Streptococcus pseudopneumoniae TaxID=257758 RepID=UPI0018B02432|nr:DUF1542 domain-containing protein [Streptococcus pseudopneumoniae]MBF9644074.1 DUF1542 domain-containing protein [Streptococcus pseudopneumoniae]